MAKTKLICIASTMIQVMSLDFDCFSRYEIRSFDLFIEILLNVLFSFAI